MTVPPPQRLRYRAVWVPVGWLLVALVVWGTLTPSPPGALAVGGDKLAHGAAYLILALWFGGLYAGAVRGAHALGLAAMGVGLELLQDAGGVRQLEVADMIANGIGVVCGWLLAHLPALSVVARLDRALEGFQKARSGSSGA